MQGLTPSTRRLTLIWPRRRPARRGTGPLALRALGHGALHRRLGHPPVQLEHRATDALSPHSRFAAAISLIRAMVSGATLGVVEGATARDVRRQKSRKPRRCQRSRVAGCTISKACRQARTRLTSTHDPSACRGHA